MTIIRVLGRTEKEKGDSFERLMKKVLDSAGYDDFRFDIHKTGREIDIKAKQKVTGYPIICECKAHGKPIASDDINKFYAVYDREYQVDNRFAGLFFSLSGFISTAKESYEELTPAIRSRFLLFDGDFVLAMLTKSKLAATPETIDYILKMKTPYNYGEKHLVCINGEIFWEQFILTDNKPTHYIILGSLGEDVPAYQCSEIASKDQHLKNLERLDISAMKKALISLLDGKIKTIEEISKDTTESIQTTLLSVQNLVSQNLLEERQSSCYRLSRDLPVFVTLAKRFLNSDDKVTFFLSVYTGLMMNSSLIDYFAQRYRLDLDSQEKEPILRLLKVSPSALNEALFGSTIRNEGTDEHLKELRNLPSSENKRIKEIMRQNVIGKLLRKLISDFEMTDVNKIYEKQGIKGWLTQISLKLAKRNELYVCVESEDLIMLLRAGSDIKAGQLLSATNYDLYIETGDILTALEKPAAAIKDYDKAISHLSENDKLKTAWNNKGLAFYAIKEWGEAIKCYDEALKIDPLLKEAWFNKGLAYTYKGDQTAASACFHKAQEIDPHYSRAIDECEN